MSTKITTGTIRENVEDFIRLFVNKEKYEIIPILPDEVILPILKIIQDNDETDTVAEILHGLGVSDFLVGYFIGRISEKEYNLGLVVG